MSGFATARLLHKLLAVAAKNTCRPTRPSCTLTYKTRRPEVPVSLSSGLSPALRRWHRAFLRGGLELDVY